jgi:hypothetical protein
MILDSTFYKNISRIVISGGSSLVFPTDVILLCDTTTGAITLTLCEIPRDAWNTVYKLYVVDNGSNASVNNITINAPAGFTINGSASLVINSNDTTAVIRIANNFAYLASLTSGGGLPLEIDSQGLLVTSNTSKIDFVGIQALLTAPNSVKVTNAFISGTALQIQALATAGNLIANQWYNVTNADYGFFVHNFNVYIPAITNKSLANFGIGEFYDADYQNVGNYSGITGFVSQLGIWKTALAPVINDVCICDNLHYKNITGVNGGIKASNDPINWQLLTYSSTNGYIVVYNQITLGGTNNKRIIYRKDKNNNEVDWIGKISSGSFDLFPFGNEKFVGNKILSGSIWDCCNTIVSDKVQYNTFNNNAEVNFSTPFAVKDFIRNVFIAGTRPIQFFGGNSNCVIQRNHFELSGSVTSTYDDCIFQDNYFFLSTFELNLSNSYNFLSNNLQGSGLLLTGSGGEFSTNYLKDAILTINNERGFVRANYINNSSATIISNEGTIADNIFEQGSNINIQNINVAGSFRQNTFTHRCSFAVSNILAPFGLNLPKGLGNIFKNCSGVLDTFTGECYANVFENCQIRINQFSGSINQNNFLTVGNIEIDNMASFIITGIISNGFGLGSPTFVMSENYASGTRNYGFSNIKARLDCSDPAIYNGGLQQLTIPIEIQEWAGEIILVNANGLTISRILQSSQDYLYRFYNDNGTTNFATVLVGVALAGDLVSAFPAPAIIPINFNVNASDFIEYQRTNLVGEIIKAQNFN